MVVDRRGDRPIYKQVADALRASIRSGELVEAQPLPSEPDLMERYGVSRNTVRNAIALLRVEGVVTTEHGRGSFVRAHRPLRRMSSSRYSKTKREAGQAPLHAEAEEQGLIADQQLLGVDVVEPPQEVADRLNMSISEEVLVRRHLLSLGGEPVQLADSYFPLSIARGTDIEQPEKIAGGVHALLEIQLGYELDRFVEELTCRMPTPEEVRRLGLVSGVPVLRLLRTLYDTSGRALEVSDFLLAGDRHALVYEVPAR